MPTYLEQLTIRLATGIAALPEEVRRRHVDYLLAGQRPDGGYAGREGDSDLYYTSFALRSLAVLGELHGPVAERSAQFLRGRLTGQESIVDFLSLVYAAALLNNSAGIDIFDQADDNWRDAVAGALEQLRRDDGGYAKGPEGRASSTYHTFLVAICLELVERPLVEPERMVEFILSQRSETGGFREIRASKRAGTNPTAAGVGMLMIAEQLGIYKMDEELAVDTIDFLCEMQTDEGGLRANTRIPIADLLSSFTGYLSLTDLRAPQEIDVEKLRKFVLSMERPAGGFQAAAWDEAHDVEYTFYGLGCLGILPAVEP